MVDSVAAGDKFKARIDVVAVEETLAVIRVLEESWGGRIRTIIRITYCY